MFRFNLGWHLARQVQQKERGKEEKGIYKGNEHQWWTGQAKVGKRGKGYRSGMENKKLVAEWRVELLEESHQIEMTWNSGDEITGIEKISRIWPSMVGQSLGKIKIVRGKEVMGLMAPSGHFTVTQTQSTGESLRLLGF